MTSFYNGGGATLLDRQDKGFGGMFWEKLLRYCGTKAVRSNRKAGRHYYADRKINSRISKSDLQNVILKCLRQDTILDIGHPINVIPHLLRDLNKKRSRNESGMTEVSCHCEERSDVAIATPFKLNEITTSCVMHTPRNGKNASLHYQTDNKIDKGANTNYNSNMMNYKLEILRKNRTFFTKSKILEKVVKRVQGDKEPHSIHSIHSTHFTHAKRAAFTLAEVLITLGIIGIVAALTIPNLVVKYQRKVMQTRFQKAYSILTEVNTRMIAENINQYRDFVRTEKDENGKYSEEARNRQLDTLASFLSGAKVCNGSYYSCSGIEDAYDFPDKIHKTLDGQNNAHIAADAYMKKTVITNDGMDIWAGGLQFGIDKYYVDTNGYNNGPNKLGYDLFRFVINSNGTVTPEKDSGNMNRCSFIEAAHGPTYLGFGCGYYAWKNINPDAPDDASQTYWDDFLK